MESYRCCVESKGLGLVSIGRGRGRWMVRSESAGPGSDSRANSAAAFLHPRLERGLPLRAVARLGPHRPIAEHAHLGVARRRTHSNDLDWHCLDAGRERNIPASHLRQSPLDTRCNLSAAPPWIFRVDAFGRRWHRCWMRPRRPGWSAFRFIASWEVYSSSIGFTAPCPAPLLCRPESATSPRACLLCPQRVWVTSGFPIGRRIGIRWNLFGLIDFAVAITMGMLTSPGPVHLLAREHPNTLIATFPAAMTPAFVVPFSTLLHVLSLRQLKRVERTRSPAIEIERPQRAEAATY